jgi:hypothetical protein
MNYIWPLYSEPLFGDDRTFLTVVGVTVLCIVIVVLAGWWGRRSR